jgi:hypothetical protein
MSGKITSERVELLYVMRRDQEEHQRQNNIQAVEKMVWENRQITVENTVETSICLAQ